jgi:hypothetical protein
MRKICFVDEVEDRKIQEKKPRLFFQQLAGHFLGSNDFSHNRERPNLVPLSLGLIAETA